MVWCYRLWENLLLVIPLVRYPVFKILESTTGWKRLIPFRKILVRKRTSLSNWSSNSNTTISQSSTLAIMSRGLPAPSYLWLRNSAKGCHEIVNVMGEIVSFFESYFRHTWKQWDIFIKTKTPINWYNQKLLNKNILVREWIKWD